MDCGARTSIIIRLQRPERAWVCGACAVSACGGVSRGASVLGWSAWPRRGFGARTRRVSGARAGVSGARASGARDAVKDKYEKETVTVDAPRYQVVPSSKPAWIG